MLDEMKKMEFAFPFKTLEDYMKRAGITNGYQSKPCLNPADPECPETAPNKKSQKVRRLAPTRVFARSEILSLRIFDNCVFSNSSFHLTYLEFFSRNVSRDGVYNTSSFKGETKVYRLSLSLSEIRKDAFCS